MLIRSCVRQEIKTGTRYAAYSMQKPIGLQPVSRGDRLHEKVYDALRQSIVEGGMKPSERVLETEVSQILGVSRTPVREAIRRLAQDGWLALLPAGGAMVKPISAQEVIDAYATRAVLEGLAAKLACKRATTSDLAELRNSVRAAESALAAGSIDGMSSFNTRFHADLVRLSNNRPLIQLTEALGIYPAYYRRLLLETTQSAEEHRAYVEYVRPRLQDHYKVVDLIATGQEEIVEQVVRAHVKVNAENMVRLLGLLEESQVG